MNSLHKKPEIIDGGIAVDDRGIVSFCNAFDFKGVKRFYYLSNHRTNFVRAWHGHKKEAKYITVLNGAAVIGAVKIDNWKNPSKELKPERFVLSYQRPQILYIPPAYANGIMNLTEDTIIMVFSTATTDESRDDDWRFKANYWNIWKVKKR